MNRQFMLTPASMAIAMVLATPQLLAQEDENLVVIGLEEDSAVGPDFSYLGAKSRTATKMDLAINETPRSVSVVTREQMDDRASISVSDALQYTPSIQTNYFGEDNKQDWFIIRGFKQANSGLYQDGTRLYSSGFYSWQIDPFALERVEVLRGAASVLYGQNPPGGVINLVSKRPQFDSGSGQVSLEYGSEDRKQISLDVNSEVNEKLAVRVQGLARKNGTRVDGVEAERFLIAPSLTYKFTDMSEITLLTSYQKDDSDPYLQFLPVEGTLKPNKNGKISDSLAIGNTDWETFEREQLSLGYEFSHRFNDTTSFVQSTRYSQMEVNLRQMYSYVYAADVPGLGPLLDPLNERKSILRAATTEEGSSDAFNIDNRLIHNMKWGSVEHNLMVGIDYQMVSIDGKDFASDPLVADGDAILTTPIGMLPDPRFDVFNPNYSDNVWLLDSTTLQPLTDADKQRTKVDNEQLGIYLQDHMLINDKWAVLLGARYDNTSNEVHNVTTGSRTKVDNEEWTLSLGTAYITDSGFTPYFSYSQYFDPIIQQDSAGKPAKPESGDQFEVGVKYQPRSFDGYFNVAAYQATKENLARIYLNELTQIGKVENKGLELEAVANVTPSLTLLGNIAYVDSEIKEDVNTSWVGNTPSQVANTVSSAWAHYRFLEGTFDGLAFGLGARYTGESYGDNTETLKVPGYFLMDATVSYRIGDYKLQVAAKNLADKEYVATCDGFCWYGDRRNVIANLTYDW
ncbi:ligand-gated channel protein [Vibrio sp. 10N.222.52.B12]|uniref:TonB-dependent siderophore receptor n=1 Tax=Vibrio sp. 10N.222.52.B12 TaxID=1880840 RepID=UPI000C85A453|nr:TonB-dependent siderophore receptor [Vibrio sp. 10N.222.52.B12]PMO45586.1 ligand-gated channel protein [Vibrio sp. 10N.222.52.B12]